jgi:DNA polymerase I-like protein with 3'-5' exonuclease and polymerase domains
MLAQTLLDDLCRAGFRLRAMGDKIGIDPIARLTPVQRALILEHKLELLRLLTAAPGPPAFEVRQVDLSGRSFPYLPRWAGQVLMAEGVYLAFDVETNLVDLAREVPRLALASASAGAQANCLIHPDDLARFVLVHQDLHWVCHHAAFDFWTVEKHLRQRGETEALAAWWQIAETNRLHDSMLLDMLVRLARDDAFPDPRRLDEVAREYAGLEITKADPYRLRYAELIGVDWSMVTEEGFWSYAIADAIVTQIAYVAIRQQAEQLLANFCGASTDILPDAVEKFGLLTEAIQVKKAIALTAIQHRGIGVDLAWVRQGEAELRQHLNKTVAQVRELCPDLYKTGPDGNVRFSAKGKPQRTDKVLREQLAAVVRTLEEDDEAAVEIRVPLTKKTRQLSTSTKFWQEYADHSAFLRHWCDVEEHAKLLQFFVQLQEERAHPKYTVMVRSGRTSASSPNIQQIPRDSDFRRAFVPSPGHFLLAVDYSFIELVTLAATCQYRYGSSRLGDIIRAGIDPHVNTAASILGKELAEFLGWKDNPAVVDGRTLAEHFKQARQKVKPVNFGVPGSLGVRSLRAYAKASYGVELSEEQARQWRDKLIKEIYPELERYLAEDAIGILARNLRVPVDQVRTALGDLHLTCIRKVIAGEPKKSNGDPYRSAYVEKVWNALLRAAKSSELLPALEARRAEGDLSPDGETKEQRQARKKRHEDLARRVCQAGVATLTGRIRGRVRYSQARNTPFQGLAADGAALALFALIKEGFRVVGFVHDETLIELPDEGGFVSEAVVRRVEQIKREGMSSVLGCDLPVSVESSLSTCWNKAAKLIVKDGKVYPWSPPQADRPEGSQLANRTKAEAVPAPAAVVVEAPPKPSAFDPASMSQEEYLTKVLRMAPEDLG